MTAATQHNLTKNPIVACTSIRSTECLGVDHKSLLALRVVEARLAQMTALDSVQMGRETRV